MCTSSSTRYVFLPILLRKLTARSRPNSQHEYLPALPPLLEQPCPRPSSRSHPPLGLERYLTAVRKDAHRGTTHKKCHVEKNSDNIEELSERDRITTLVRSEPLIHDVRTLKHRS